jgi:hypothetical protein
MDKFTKSLGQRIAVLEKIVHALRDTPREQNEKTITSKNNTRDEQDSVQPRSPSFPQGNPAAIKEQKAKSKWDKRIERWKPSLEIIGIFFAIGYAFVTYFQWRDLRDNFVTGQRAWVGVVRIVVDHPVSGASPRSIVTMHNFGLSPARQLDTNTVTVTIAADNRSKAIQEAIKDIDRGPWENLAMVLPQSVGSDNVNTSRRQFTDTAIKAFAEERAWLIVVGRIKYADIFDKQRMTTFCGFYSPKKFGTVLESCGVFNEMQ